MLFVTQVVSEEGVSFKVSPLYPEPLSCVVILCVCVVVVVVGVVYLCICRLMMVVVRACRAVVVPSYPSSRNSGVRGVTSLKI